MNETPGGPEPFGKFFAFLLGCLFVAALVVLAWIGVWSVWVVFSNPGSAPLSAWIIVVGGAVFLVVKGMNIYINRKRMSNGALPRGFLRRYERALTFQKPTAIFKIGLGLAGAAFILGMLVEFLHRFVDPLGEQPPTDLTIGLWMAASVVGLVTIILEFGWSLLTDRDE